MPDRKVSIAKHPKKVILDNQREAFLAGNTTFRQNGNPSVQEVRDQVRFLSLQVSAILERLAELEK